MATGDVIVFEEAKEYLLDGGFEAADEIWIAILDNTATPTAAFATPALGDFTEVGTAGSYAAGGLLLDTLGDLVTEAAGTATFDTTGTSDNETPTWAQNASNDIDAWWGLIYNNTDAGDRAIAFIELGGPVDMSAGSLTVTFNASGIFTVT